MPWSGSIGKGGVGVESVIAGDCQSRSVIELSDPGVLGDPERFSRFCQKLIRFARNLNAMRWLICNMKLPHLKNIIKGMLLLTSFRNLA